MKFIKQRIEEAYKKNELICICLHDIDWDKRIIGFVKKIYVSDKFDLVVIDEFGQKKGIKKITFSSVRSLEIGGIYNENLKTLHNHGFLKGQSSPRYLSAGKYNLHQKLGSLKEAGTLCTFFFDTEFSIGIVTEIGEEEFSINNIGHEGTEDGTSVFDVSLLTQIRCGTNFEERIAFLNRYAQI